MVIDGTVVLGDAYPSTHRYARVLYIFLPISIPLRTTFRNQRWYGYDILSIAVFYSFLKSSFLLSLLCRWIVLLQNLSILRKKWNARKSFGCCLCIYAVSANSIEILLPTPQIMIDNTPSEWKRASASFQASCGTESKEFRILYTGGSSGKKAINWWLCFLHNMYISPCVKKDILSYEKYRWSST